MLNTYKYAVGLLMSISMCVIIVSCADANPTRILDIVWVSTSDILVASGPGGIYTSKDQGNSWQVTKIPIAELAITPNNRIWGRQSYRHPEGGEPGPQYLVVSDDGIIWEKIELDPTIILPVGFLSVDGNEPVLLGQDGKIWALDESKDHSLWTSWYVRNDLSEICKRTCISGIIVGDTIYVANLHGIATFSPEQPSVQYETDVRIAGFGSNGSQCWAISISGTLYTVSCGQADWQIEQSILEISRASNLRYSNGMLVVVGENDSQNAIFSQFMPNDPSPIISRVDDTPNSQAFAATSDEHGTYWVVTEYGIYSGDGKTWERKFP